MLITLPIAYVLHFLLCMWLWFDTPGSDEASFTSASPAERWVIRAIFPPFYIVDFFRVALTALFEAKKNRHLNKSK